MDQAKIDAFNEQNRLQAEERAKIEDTALAVMTIVRSQKDIEKTIKDSILSLAKYLNTIKPEVSVTNQKDFPSLDGVIGAVNEVVKEVRSSNKALDTVGKKEVDLSKVVASLEKLSGMVAKLPTEFPKPPEVVKIENQPDYTKKFDEVKDAVGKIPAPIVNVEKPIIPDNTKDLEKIVKAVQGIKLPEIPKTDFSPVEKAVKDVQKAINSLVFPVANYVLPFKDINGKAVQVQLDASGNIPTSGGSSNGLTDAELRATPVPVTANPPTAVVSTVNSTTTPLTGSATFTGTWEAVSNYDYLQVTLDTDVDSATDGAVISFSTDGGVTTERSLSNTITGGLGAYSYIIPLTGYTHFKITYTNGSSGQAVFHLHTSYKNGANAPGIIAPLGAVINATYSAGLTRAVLAGQLATGAVQNLAVDSSGRLKIDVANHDVDTPIKSPTNAQAYQVSIGTTATRVDSSPLTGRKSISLKLAAAATQLVYIGFDNTVTTGNGRLMDLGDSIDLDLTEAKQVWAIADTTSQTLYVTETAT